jgi:t-SNARE complex subunit (syntaxin)
MQKRTGYGRASWKKWLAIYAIAGAIVYVIVYVVFFAHSGGGVGPY